jgi:hypothetical protein
MEGTQSFLFFFMFLKPVICERKHGKLFSGFQNRNGFEKVGFRDLRAETQAG